MAHVKKELLEHLIRQCVREVLDQIHEDDTVGAAAPPADGTGSNEQIPFPKKPSSYSLTETRLKKELVNVKTGKPMSPQIMELKRQIKRLVKEVFSE